MELIGSKEEVWNNITKWGNMNGSVLEMMKVKQHAFRVHGKMIGMSVGHVGQDDK